MSHTVRSTVPKFNASSMIGLNVILINTVIKFEGVDEIIIPSLEELSKVAAVKRCFLIQRLLPNELKAIRKICGWSRINLLETMGLNNLISEVELWESEENSIPEVIEKLFRIVVWSHLHRETPGVFDQLEFILSKKFITNKDSNPPRMEFYRTKFIHDGKHKMVWTTECEPYSIVG